MLKTKLQIMGKRGYSNHEAVLIVTEDVEGKTILHIIGPKGCDLTLPWEDVIEAGMIFVESMNGWKNE